MNSNVLVKDDVHILSLHQKRTFTVNAKICFIRLL